MGATEILARFIAGLRYDELPAGVVEAAKLEISVIFCYTGFSVLYRQPGFTAWSCTGYSPLPVHPLSRLALTH